MDDLLVYSATEKEHLQDVRETLQRLRENKLHARRDNCEVCVTSTPFLGHIIEAGVVRVDPEKISAVKDWPQPTSVKQIQSFLGFCNYYNRFIEGYSRIIAPLATLLQKDVPFCWGPTQQAAFDQLKQVLTSAPILRMP